MQIRKRIHLVSQATYGDGRLAHSSLYIAQIQSFTSHNSGIYPSLCIFTATHLVHVTTVWMPALVFQGSLVVFRFILFSDAILIFKWLHLS